MFTRILVALDGSRRAEGALPAAARMVRAAGGELILATAVASPVPSEYGEYDSLSSDTVRAECTDAEAYLNHVRELPDLAGIDTMTTVKMGSPAAALLEAISDNHADLVVLTSHGRTGFARWALGSVTQHLERHSEVPVLVLRDQSALATPYADLEHLFRVLVCLDGGPYAEAAVEPAAKLALGLREPDQAGLHTVLVLPPFEADPANRPESLVLDGARRYLARVAGRLKEVYPGLTATWTVAVGVDTAGSIIRVAESGEDVEGAGVFGGCDVIAIATHGRTGLPRWALGSVAEQVLDGSRLPVLVVRSPAGAEVDQRWYGL